MLASTSDQQRKAQQLLLRLAAGKQTVGSTPPVTSPRVTLVPVQWSTPPAETALEHCQRGIALTNEGYYEQAIAEFNKAIELNPNRFTAYYGRGLAYEEQGKKDEAIAYIAREQPTMDCFEN